MRYVAMLAVGVIAAWPLLLWLQPAAFLFGGYLFGAPVLGAILWYALFTLPRELIDRHAANLRQLALEQPTPAPPMTTEASSAPAPTRSAVAYQTRTGPLGRLS